MKKILFSALLLFAVNSNAQLGVTTIRPRKPVPIGQWYNVNAKWGNNRIFFYDLKANVDTLLNELLLPWNLSIANGESDEDGDDESSLCCVSIPQGRADLPASRPARRDRAQPRRGWRTSLHS